MAKKDKNGNAGGKKGNAINATDEPAELDKTQPEYDSVVAVGRAWLYDESILYRKTMDEYKELDKVKGKKRDSNRMNKLDGEICRLVDEYLAEARRVMRAWLALNDECYQRWLNDLDRLGKELGEDAMADLEPIVVQIKEIKAGLAAAVEAEILKGPDHVERCRAVVEHEEAMNRIRLEIGDLELGKNKAAQEAKQLGDNIKKLVNRLEKRIEEGPIFSPGPLFDQPTKEDHREKQYAVNENDVFTEPDKIELKFAKKLKCKAELRYAQATDGRWYHGYDVSVGNSSASSPVKFDQVAGWDTKTEAVKGAADDVTEWLEVTEPAGMEAIIEAVAEQIPD